MERTIFSILMVAIGCGGAAESEDATIETYDCTCQDVSWSDVPLEASLCSTGEDRNEGEIGNALVLEFDGTESKASCECVQTGAVTQAAYDSGEFFCTFQVNCDSDGCF